MGRAGQACASADEARKGVAMTTTVAAMIQFLRCMGSLLKGIDQVIIQIMPAFGIRESTGWVSVNHHFIANESKSKSPDTQGNGLWMGIVI
jgi:hypothetical protein